MTSAESVNRQGAPDRSSTATSSASPGGTGRAAAPARAEASAAPASTVPADEGAVAPISPAAWNTGSHRGGPAGEAGSRTSTCGEARLSTSRTSSEAGVRPVTCRCPPSVARSPNRVATNCAGGPGRSAPLATWTAGSALSRAASTRCSASVAAGSARCARRTSSGRARSTSSVSPPPLTSAGNAEPADRAPAVSGPNVPRRTVCAGSTTSPVAWCTGKDSVSAAEYNCAGAVPDTVVRSIAAADSSAFMAGTWPIRQGPPGRESNPFGFVRPTQPHYPEGLRPS